MSINLSEIRARCEAATKGPWKVWDGPSYCGGGADLCIGQGEKWLCNMGHRQVEGHNPGCETKGCVICFDITKEQQANAELIADARTDIPALLDRIEELEMFVHNCYAEWGCDCQMEEEDGSCRACLAKKLLTQNKPQDKENK